MKFEDIYKELRSGAFRSLYFLFGDESYFIDRITDYIAENALDESEKSFNQTVLYGRDVNASQIVETAKRFPMMAEKQVVIIKEAQNITNYEALESYFQNPVATTILVFAYKYKKPDKRKKAFKLAQANGVYFESKKLYENQIPDWVKTYLGSHGHQITPKASIMIAEFLGTELSKISNELDKLLLNVNEGKTIDDHDIQENIGISKDFNFFELQKAIATRNFGKANQIGLYFAQNPKHHPFVVTLSLLNTFFSKVIALYFDPVSDKFSAAKKLRISPFVAEEYLKAKSNYSAPKAVQNISILREYDLRSKGIEGARIPDGELLKELVYRLMH